MEQATSLVTPEVIEQSVPLGPDPEPIVRAVREAEEAGVDHIVFPPDRRPARRIHRLLEERAATGAGLMVSARNTAASPAYVAPAGLLVLLLLFTGLGLGPASPGSQPSSPSRPGAAASGAHVRQTLDSMGDDLDSIESPDFAMAWGDLRSDLRSVSEDLDRYPGDVDVEAVIQRVSGFREQFESNPAMSETKQEWDSLVAALRSSEAERSSSEGDGR